MYRLLVTGSSGLVGRWTCQNLVGAGYNVGGVDKRRPDFSTAKYSFFQGDLLDECFVKDVLSVFQPHAIIHLAARTDLDGSNMQDYASNTDAIDILCRSISGCDSISRAIFASSQLVCETGYVPKDEFDFRPSTVYGHSKVETELRVRSNQGGGAIWSIVRPTTVWGPYMSEHYRSVIRHIEKGRYFHSGDGELFKSYSYAGNIAHQLCKILEAEPKTVDEKVFYLADYEPVSLRRYVDCLADELGVRRPVTVPLTVARLIARGGDVINAAGVRFPYNTFRLNNIRSEYVFDLSNTASVCGDLPFSFEDGIRSTVSWYKSTN